MIKPRIKPEHAPYRVAEERSESAGCHYGIAAEISDPDGWVWTMLTAMDGSRDLAEIVEQVHSAHPAQPVDVLRRGAEQLVSSGYAEDAAGPVPANLTDRDLLRYDRAVGFYRWLDLTPRASSWEPQSLLRDARVTVLGLGGSGGVAALALAASGVGRLHCVDPDDVELSNLSRQVLYTEADIGKPKADSAITRLRQLNSDIEITGQRTELPARRTCSAWPPARRPPAHRRPAAGTAEMGEPGLPFRAAAVGLRRVPRPACAVRCIRPGRRSVLGMQCAHPRRPGMPREARIPRIHRSARPPCSARWAPPRPACPATWPPSMSSRCSPAYRAVSRPGQHGQPRRDRRVPGLQRAPAPRVRGMRGHPAPVIETQ